ncbi:hypothetical protein BU16DRAFT_530874 [Lophium mytilinum]|uniref:Uncharacterized protein n=1 Tax=Lophium mytilinum TaxID=390894 RepID=A0A6A6QD74_9PEZI|nr:hypothetical protein BU16DRAFT_530874 [Lophium mytilinum]
MSAVADAGDLDSAMVCVYILVADWACIWHFGMTTVYIGEVIGDKDLKIGGDVGRHGR